MASQQTGITGELYENESEHRKDIAGRVSAILDALEAENLELGEFLTALAGIDNPRCQKERRFAMTRSKLYSSSHFTNLIRRWYRHRPNMNGPRKKMLELATEELLRTCDQEMLRFDKRMTNIPTNHAMLKAFSFVELMEWARSEEGLPTLWSLLDGVAQRPRARLENTEKDPSMMLVVVLGQLSYSRSTHNNWMQQVLSVFLEGIGVPTRAFELMHQIGLTLSLKWSQNAVGTLSQDNLTRMAQDLLDHAFFMSGDNVNIRERVFSQRLHNRNRFDSGTAVTLFITQQPPLRSDLAAEYRRLHGQHATIGYPDFYDRDALIRLQNLKEYHILNVLLTSPLAASGPSNAMKMYVIKTMKIDQASLEGNVQWVMEAVKQIGYGGTLDAKKTLATSTIIPIVGDELTHKCLRRIRRLRGRDHNCLERFDFTDQVFGWFHAEMALAQALWQLHSGSRLGTGLSRDVSLLKRIHFPGRREKGAQTDFDGTDDRREEQASASAKNDTKAKGPTAKEASQICYHDLDELIHHSFTGHVLAVWVKEAGVSDLDGLKTWNPAPEELVQLKKKILNDYASTRALPKGKPEDLNRLTKAQKKAAEEAKSNDDPDATESAKNQAAIFFNSARFMRDALNYITLRAAIRAGDVRVMEDMLPILALFFKGSGRPKYAILMLEEMQRLKNEYPAEYREWRLKHCWVVSGTGRPGDFYPVDLAQEHNNRDLKVVHAAKGSNASWAYIAKMSPVIPTFKEVTNTIARSFPTTINGNKHSSPDEWPDIQRLAEFYISERLAYQVPESDGDSRTKRVNAVKVSTDALNSGTNALQSKAWLAEWINNRRVVISTLELWKEEEERDVTIVSEQSELDGEDLSTAGDNEHLEQMKTEHETETYRDYESDVDGSDIEYEPSGEWSFRLDDSPRTSMERAAFVSISFE
ncbi:hypothetical protein FRC04_002015 [Tulasnella sp. 424]|nr:hypothetical protein FRC04_002015 [Tulasnella sp. 424]KAG8968049.1 hypothetical protein FRC05_001682 [Tulasnella sp. 425]